MPLLGALEPPRANGARDAARHTAAAVKSRVKEVPPYSSRLSVDSSDASDVRGAVEGGAAQGGAVQGGAVHGGAVRTEAVGTEAASGPLFDRPSGSGSGRYSGSYTGSYTAYSAYEYSTYSAGGYPSKPSPSAAAAAIGAAVIGAAGVGAVGMGATDRVRSEVYTAARQLQYVEYLELCVEQRRAPAEEVTAPSRVPLQLPRPPRAFVAPRAWTLSHRLPSARQTPSFSWWQSTSHPLSRRLCTNIAYRLHAGSHPISHTTTRFITSQVVEMAAKLPRSDPLPPEEAELLSRQAALEQQLGLPSRVPHGSPPGQWTAAGPLLASGATAAVAGMLESGERYVYEADVYYSDEYYDSYTPGGASEHGQWAERKR